MAGDWRHQGNAQRRRMGAPSSHSGGIPPVMADPMQEGLSGMAKVGNPRQPMDREALNSMVNRSAEPESMRGSAMPKKGAQSGDPGLFPTDTRPNVLQENGGARYATRVRMPVVSPAEAGPTTANGRIISGQQAGRGRPFYGGAAD